MPTARHQIANIVSVAHTMVRLAAMKVFYPNNIYFSAVERFSPNVVVDTDRRSRICFGKRVSIHSGCRLNANSGGELTIGSNTSFNVGCIVTCKKKIEIGKSVSFGPNVVIYDHNHIMGKNNGVKGTGFTKEKVSIGDNTWIGAGVTILSGAKIGKNCIIAAGSIVTGEVPDNTVLIQKRENYYKRVAEDDE